MRFIFFALCFNLTSLAQAEVDVFDLAAKYNKTSKGLTDLEVAKRKILAEIFEIEKKTNKLVIEKNDMDEKKMNLDGELSKTSQQIVRIEKEVEVLLPELVDRLRFTDHVNQLPWFYTFLTSQSLADLEVTLNTAKHINSEQGESVAKFATLLKQLETNKKKLTSVARDIVGAQKELAIKEKEIEKSQVLKKKYLAKLNRRLNTQKRNLKKLKGKGKEALSKMNFKDMEILFGSRFFDKKGDLPHPVKLAVTHHYGLNKGLVKDRIQLVHKGHFYSSNKEAKVKAVAPGKVKFSGKVEGWGQTVIIDHGSRYYTTYSNMGKTEIKINKEVKTGTLLGVTGHDHLQMGRGVYFEIRHFSQPQNPKNWLKKSNQQLATL